MRAFINKIPLDLILLMLCLVIFYIDLSIPLGVAAGVPYVTVILVALTSRRQSTTLLWATVCTLLTLAGYYISPLGSDTWKVVINRILAIYAIWAVAIVSLILKQRAQKLSQLEGDLEISEFRATLGLVAEYAKDAIVITDKKGVITWVNQGFISLSGYQLEEVVGSKPGRLLQGKATDISTVKRLSEAIKQARPIACEIVNYHKNGTPYWIDISISPVFEKGELIKFIAVERDITERKNLELQLQADRNLAISDSEQTDNLLYLLNYFVIQQSRLATKGLGGSDADVMTSKEHLELLQSVSHHVGFMVMGGDGDKPLTLQDVSETLIQDLYKFSTKMGFEYSNHIDQSIEPLVIASHGELTFRFAFHLAMVIALTQQPSALAIEVKASCCSDKTELQLDFICEDNGELLDTVQKLLTSGYDASDKVLTALEYAHRKALNFLHEHNGQVNGYISGNSSHFCIIQSVELLQNKQTVSRDYSILIAEDNKVNTIVLKKLLQTLGYDNVDTVVNGSEAVDVAKNNRYDLILMDNHMPQMTGLEATKLLKSKYAINATVIACTADTSTEATKSFLEYGAQSVIYKPIKKEQLRRELAVAVNTQANSVAS